MRGYAVGAVLLLVLPASATISYVRSANTWSGGTGSCAVTLSATNTTDLLVVWGEWQTSGSNTVTVATVSDAQGKSVRSAVGPTVQSTGNIAGQIFYVADVSTGGDSVTLNFSGTVASSACVIVEFSGADVNYPLDSVSAGYSSASNPTNLLDSGNAAPANSNLMVFAAGFADTNTALIAGSNFTSQQASHGTWGTGIVENSTTAISGNNVLQRATACLSTGVSCSGGTADWLMQMAIFRDASWSVSGGWSPARPPDVINAAQYPGVDICTQAQNAALANPSATILMPINGTMACSVDPTGAASTSAITSAPAFKGKLKLVAVGGSPGQLNMDTPWVFFNSGMGLDAGNVQFVITQAFRNNWSAKRCWTEASADSTDFGACATGAIGNNFKIQAGASTSNCAQITYPGSTAPYEIRGGEIITITEASDPRNDGVFRVIPNGDTCGAGVPTATTFYIWAPSAQSCTGTACGSRTTLAAQTAMFYMAPRAFDDPNNTGQSCITLKGGDQYSDPTNAEKCNRFGIKLLNLGELDGGGYGVEGIDNSDCMEQCAVDSYGSRTVYRTSMLSYGQWSSVAQNNAAIRHLEDYCDSTTFGGPYDCASTGTGGSTFSYGVFHVGVWLRDTWNHGAVEDATFNEPSWVGIMLDGMGGYSTGSSIKGIHFQNGGKNGNAAGNLANIAIGAQAAANGVYIEQTEGNGDTAVAANILIAGPTQNPPTSNMVNWQASNPYAPYDAVLPPIAINAGGYIFENTVAGTSGASHPSWSSAQTPGQCVLDNGGPMNWCNVGTTLPNSTGPGGNMVKAIVIANDSGNTTTIFNAQTNTSWTDESIADYTYQNDSGSIYECSSDAEHPCAIGQGINLVSPLFSSGAPTISSGFGTLPSITTSNGSASFLVNVGGGGTATSGVLALPSAAHGWTCVVNDISAAFTNQPYNTRQTAYSVSSVTLQNQALSTGAATVWGLNDLLQLSCTAF